MLNDVSYPLPALPNQHASQKRGYDEYGQQQRFQDELESAVHSYCLCMVALIASKQTEAMAAANADPAATMRMLFKLN